MVICYKRKDREGNLGRYRVLLSSKHPGLTYVYKVKYRSSKSGTQLPRLLQESVDYFDGKDEDVYEVLMQLESACLLVPGIWRADIVLRALRDPFYEDPSFLLDGYIMGLLIPYDIKIPATYFRLLAFKWTKGEEGQDKYPYTIRLCT